MYRNNIYLFFFRQDTSENICQHIRYIKYDITVVTFNKNKEFALLPKKKSATANVTQEQPQ
jgi:hypothetical protein